MSPTQCPRNFKEASVFFLFVMFSYPSALLAQGKSGKIDLKDSGKLTPPSVKIVLEASKPRLVAAPGLGLGVIAKITNLGERPIYLRPEGIVVGIPGELGPFNPYTEDKNRLDVFWMAAFPTETWAPGGELNPRKDHWVVVPPNETYAAFWYVGSSDAFNWDTTLGQKVNWLRARMYFMNFVPGEYKATVVGKYWTDAAMPPDNYHTFTETVVLPASAPQFVILFGAAMGGLIGWAVFGDPGAPRTPPRSPSTISRDPGESVWRWRARRLGHQVVAGLRVARAAAGAALLAIIVTILVSRLSDSQFFVRVNVNDLWGAIAVGFGAQYLGVKAIENLLGKRDQSLGQRGAPRNPDAPDPRVSGPEKP